MRVVTDTNVIVSALLWMGAPQKILIAAEKAQVTLCVSPALLQELVGVLERPKFTQRLRDLRVSAAELMSGYVCLAHVVLPQPSHLRHLYETYSISCNAPPRPARLFGLFSLFCFFG